MLRSSLQALRSTLFIWGSVYRDCDLAIRGGGLGFTRRKYGGLTSQRPRCLRIFSRTFSASMKAMMAIGP